MNDTVQAAFAASLSQVTRVVDEPQPPFGYGSDLACSLDLDERFRETDPFSVEGISQAIVRMLDCPRGENPDAPDYGISLRSYVHRGTTTHALRRVEYDVREQVLRDDRVRDLTVSATAGLEHEGLIVSLRVTPADARLLAFDMVFSVSAYALSLLEAP